MTGDARAKSSAQGTAHPDTRAPTRTAIKSVGQITAPLCPEGASENSPAFQRRVSAPNEQVRPGGTAENREYSQSSLRDESPYSGLPGVETPGYYQVSLRDNIPEARARRF